MKKCAILGRRFTGKHSQRAIVEELAKQEIITGHSNAMTELARRGKVRVVRPGQTLIKQGAAANDVFFILCGKLTVKRHNREITDRGPRENVGEMAMIDRSQMRSATVIAAEETVVLQVTESDFTAVANQYPELWRNLAQQGAKRLRQRLESVRPKNNVPIVFIGSSTESLHIARIVQKVLSRVAIVRFWKEDVFHADQFTLESLEQQTRQVDYAIMVFASDDQVFSRKKDFVAPRDNVVFELGLFMGTLGRKRVFLIKPHNRNLKIPSDLFGKNHIEYKTGPGKTNEMAVKEACLGLIAIIKREGAL